MKRKVREEEGSKGRRWGGIKEGPKARIPAWGICGVDGYGGKFFMDP